MDKDNERSDRIKIICDPTTTLMKIRMTSDEDTTSLLLSSSVAAQSDTVMKIFLMSPDSIDLERPTKAEFAIMWDAVNKMHEPLVIIGSAEAENQLVEIIRKKLRAKQLPHASDRLFANSRGSHTGISMANSRVPSTNKHVVKKNRE
jgi:hypothetical protein